MKNVVRALLVACLAVGLVGTLSSADAAGPTLVVPDAPVDLAKETKVVFKGTGFKPGQMLSILFTDVDGVQADIGYALEPEPKADASGNFETTWDAKRYISKKLVKEGDFTVVVTDEDYNELDSKKLKFIGKPKKKEKKGSD